nr:YciI family protein [Roseomonas acroporae]
MLVTPAAAERYLEAEPFRREGVWRDWSVHPFRLAPLDYRPLPRGPAPAVPSHTVVIAWDGRDAAAPDRRLAVREAHFGRARAAASAGIITLGGALLESPGGRMIGSLAITAHPDVAVARAWWAADPYVTGGVWQEIAWHATRFAPLPYRPLLGAAA